MAIVIIGAGIGGLSAAIRLASAGEQVIVLEQNARVGGKMNEIAADGFRWDTGPSVITMRHVFEDLFAAAGRKFEKYVTLLPLDPLTRYFYPDGVILDATDDLTQMAQRIEAIAPGDAAGYRNYLAYAARIHRITGPVFIYDQPPTIQRILRTPLRDMPAVDPLRTMDGAIRSFVRSPHLRQMLGRFATYVGGNPFSSPATLNVIADVELSGGVCYPRGGVYAIARAFERLARELGVEVVTNARVEQIDVEDGRVTGVRLLNGDRIAAEAVIANVDVATVYEHLLPREIVPAAKLRRLVRAEPSCSGFLLLLGVEGGHPQLAHHNIFFSSDYKREFDDIFRRGMPPDEPTIYVSITSKGDPGHAPAGHENWFVMVNAPAYDARYDWREGAATYRERVLARLATFGLDVHGKIRAEHMLTPLDLERMSGARRGALYGQSSNGRLSALRRPHNRASDVRGLYFTGGTTHPGGGVPKVTLSGKVAAAMVLEDLGR
ncbi:MAG: phytoene desaturase [Anaerolineae bacterium]|nr:phytoene desaturase [Anaerolineae bacterium]